MPKPENVIPHKWKKGDPSPNPAGRPIGSKNWSAVIRELVEDEDHPIKFANGETRKYPAWVIADVMIRKAASGDVAAFNALIKAGYGDKLDITSGGEKIQTPQVYLPNRGKIEEDDTTLPSV